MAEAFELELVAEGMETEVVAATLLRHARHRAQGSCSPGHWAEATWPRYSPGVGYPFTFPQRHPSSVG